MVESEEGKIYPFHEEMAQVVGEAHVVKGSGVGILQCVEENNEIVAQKGHMADFHHTYADNEAWVVEVEELEAWMIHAEDDGDI